MTTFQPPKGQIVRVQYIKTHPDGSKEVLAIITENVITTKFYLYMPDKSGKFAKVASNNVPDFKEVQNLYGPHA